MPAVTVAIPAYKPRHLADAIKSVLQQDFSDFELLISDDRTDGSVKAVASCFRDPRIKVLDGPRCGLVANSAFLWDQASSDLIKFLYDDDFLYPLAIGELVRHIDKRPDFVYSFCNRILVDGNGDVIDRPKAFQSDGWMWFDPEYIPAYTMERIFNRVGEPSNILIRKSAFSSSKCLTEFAGFPIRHLIDIAFYMNAGMVGPCVATSQHLTAFRVHADQVSSRTRAPAFSAGVFEWEIFLRGGVHLGLVEPGTAVKGVAHLNGLYQLYEDGFEELRVLRRRLPGLSESLAAGVTSVITQQFRDDLEMAHRLISRRSAAVAVAAD